MRISKAVFPAAGLGTRFLPATKAQPKEMLPLVDKPLIQYVVEEAVASGIESVIIVTGRGKSAIEDHFDVSFELEALLRERGKEDDLRLVRQITDMVRFSYVRQREALGLGHAILQARDLVGDEPFAAMFRAGTGLSGVGSREEACPGGAPRRPYPSSIDRALEFTSTPPKPHLLHVVSVMHRISAAIWLPARAFLWCSVVPCKKR